MIPFIAHICIYNGGKFYFDAKQPFPMLTQLNTPSFLLPLALDMTPIILAC